MNPPTDGGMCFVHPRCTTLTAEAIANILESMYPFVKSKKAMLTLAAETRDMIIADPGIVQDILAGGTAVIVDRDGHIRKRIE